MGDRRVRATKTKNHQKIAENQWTRRVNGNQEAIDKKGSKEGIMLRTKRPTGGMYSEELAVSESGKV